VLRHVCHHGALLGATARARGYTARSANGLLRRLAFDNLSDCGCEASVAAVSNGVCDDPSRCPSRSGWETDVALFEDGGRENGT